MRLKTMVLSLSICLAGCNHPELIELVSTELSNNFNHHDNCNCDNSVVFFEDFERGLCNWTGKEDSTHSAEIVIDSLPSNNSRVVTFKEVTARGDIYTKKIFAPGQYILSFDYAGVEKDSSVAGNLGGFIGVIGGLTGYESHKWLAGTSLSGGAESDILIDDNSWHTYKIEFETDFPFHLTLEDFWECGKTAGDVFFDNITLETK